MKRGARSSAAARVNASRSFFASQYGRFSAEADAIERSRTLTTRPQYPAGRIRLSHASACILRARRIGASALTRHSSSIRSTDADASVSCE